MQTNTRLTWQQKEWAYDMWCIGYTQEQIGEALGVSYMTIRRAIHGRARIIPILKYPHELIASGQRKTKENTINANREN